MIRKDQLARACCINDDQSDRGIPVTNSLPGLGFNAADVHYTALQRALRCYAVLRGRDPVSLTMQDLHRMSNDDRMILAALAASFVDGLAVGARTLQEV